MDSNITLQTKQMIDSLKAVCTNFGLGNASSEYKIITEVFLYKFLNDKFLFEAKRVEPALAKLSPADAEKQLAQMTDDDYELFLLGFGPDTAKLKQTHFISYLFNRKNEENFHTVFDDTLLDIATYNIDKVNGVFRRNKSMFASEQDANNKKALRRKLLSGAKDFAVDIIQKNSAK